MIKQCKGKDLGKVPASKLLQDGWYASIKYDGNYVQIHKNGNNVQFFTSGGKEFYLDHIADELINLNPNYDFIIEAEYIGASSGKLGQRTKAAKLTTYRTEFTKGIKSRCIPGKDIFKVFDLVAIKNLSTDCHWVGNKVYFKRRLSDLKQLNLGTHCEVVGFSLGSLSDFKAIAKIKAKEGYEGMYLKHENHLYHEGKRVNDAVKLKLRPTADLLCIGIEAGEGKYTGMIGSLILKDSKGRTVNVGSGLSDEQRNLDYYDFVDKVVEIEYEQIIGTYIQPVFSRVRLDKSKEEID